MSTVSQTISVELPAINDFPINHIVKCGDSVVEIMMCDWEELLWRPTASHIEKMDMTPRSYKDALSLAREHALHLEVVRLMHLQLGSVLGEI